MKREKRRIQDQLRRLKRQEEKGKKRTQKPQKQKPLTTINVGGAAKNSTNQYTCNYRRSENFRVVKCLHKNLLCKNVSLVQGTHENFFTQGKNLALK